MLIESSNDEVLFNRNNFYCNSVKDVCNNMIWLFLNLMYENNCQLAQKDGKSSNNKL